MSSSGRTLRLALAMRGGVSLAVWIGGAVAELDVLRRTTPTPAGPTLAGGDPDDGAVSRRSALYAVLLALAGYDAVEIDILAGASAGGLNAVLYAVAQSAEQSVDGLRADWLQMGDIGNLIRPTRLTRAGARLRAPSVLRGDAYFLRRLAGRLRSMLSSPPSGRGLPIPEHLTVTLSATMLPSEGVAPLEPQADEGRAYFHFVGLQAPAGCWISDIPRRDDDGVEQAAVAHQIARLALAGRSTSSFPAAFEPGRVNADAAHTRQPVFHGDSDAPEMVEVFSAARGDAESGVPFLVVDGGVFDNIPIARGLRAIALAPASGPTDRRLLYLDPDPPKPTPRRPGHTPVMVSTRGRRVEGPVYGGLATVRRVLAMRKSSETARADLEEIRAFNEAALARRVAVEAFTRQLRTVLEAAGPATSEVIMEAIDQAMAMCYPAQRAAADVPRLTELLLRPQQTVGRQLWFDLLRPVSDEAGLLGRLPPLAACYEATPGQLASDLTAVVTTAEFLIGWIRELENRGEIPDARPLKRQLYRILTTAVAFRDRSEHALPELLAGEVPTSATLGPALTEMWNRQNTLAPADLVDALDPAGYDAVAFHGALACGLVATQRGAPTLPSGSTGQLRLPDELWRHLTAAFTQLTKLTAEVEAPPGSVDDADGTWSASPYRLLAFDTALNNAVAGDITRLGPLFAAAGGLPGTVSEVRFQVLGGDEESPFADQLPRARALVVTKRADEILDGLVPDSSRPWLDSRAKLAGNQLANFGGFLSVRWRANDWMWGRADAAANIPRLLLADRERIARRVSDPTNGVTREALSAAWKATGEDPLPAALVGPGAISVDQAAEWLDTVQQRATQRLQWSVLADGSGPVTAAPDTGPEPPAPSTPVGDQLIADFAVGGETIGSLTPAYRGLLAMRVGLAAYQTLWPIGLGIRPVLARVALILLRPVLLLACLAAIPARVALLVALTLFAPALTAPPVEGLEGRARAWTLVAAVTAAALLVTWRAGRVRRNYRTVAAVLSEPGPDTPTGTDLVVDARYQANLRSRWHLGVAAAVLVVVLAASAWLLLPGSPAVTLINSLPATAYLLLLVAVAAAPWVAARLPLRWFATSPDRRGRRQGQLLWLAALAALVCAFPFANTLHDQTPYVALVLAALLTAVSVWDWLVWWAAALTVVIAAGALWVSRAWSGPWNGLPLAVLTVPVIIYLATMIVASALFPARGEIPDLPPVPTPTQ